MENICVPQASPSITLIYNGIILDKIPQRTLWSEFCADPLKRILSQGLPTAEQLAKQVPLKSLEKFDDFLPESLLSLSYSAIAFDVDELKQ